MTPELSMYLGAALFGNGLVIILLAVLHWRSAYCIEEPIEKLIDRIAEQNQREWDRRQ